MKAITLYNNAVKITKTNAIQKGIFDYWLSHNNLDIYETLSFDTETTGVTFNMPTILHLPKTDIRCNNVAIFGMSMCIPYKNNLALIWSRAGTDLFTDCCRLLNSEGRKVAHNLKFDLRTCDTDSIKVNGFCDCTLTQARIHWNTRKRFDLKTLTPLVCPELADYDNELKMEMRNLRSSYTRAGFPKNYTNYSFLPDKLISKYAMIDAFIAWLLNLDLKPKMNSIYDILYNRELRIIRIVIEAEKRGHLFDSNQASTEIYKLKDKNKRLLNKLYKILGFKFNYKSSKQLLKVLEDDLGISQNLLKHKGKLSSNKKVFDKLNKKIKDKRVKKIIDTILNLRSYDKLVGTYLVPLRRRAITNSGIIYCNINPTNTRTGRMSSNNPNLMNIPRPTSGYDKDNSVRKCFICRTGYTNFYYDYSQMEMWLFAFSANETTMLKALENGVDVHETTAIEMLGKHIVDKDNKISKDIRQLYKQVNFGIIYGMGSRGLSEFLDISFVKASDMRKAYLIKFPAINEFIHRCKVDLARKGYIEDIFGRRYSIDPAKAYKAVNAIVQGSCAQILKIATIGIQDYYNSIKYRVIPHILLFEHDEIIDEKPNILQNMFDEMNYAVCEKMTKIKQLVDRGLILQVNVSNTITSWAEKKELEVKV